ncbi:flagellar basal-body MS-ring/collar protein FliF [Ureibacillus acetophenoni]|uniref:Flagellar M-ring protein n=1 Tax=Ureibacillus acetophenoni TaxID=614649 RepID=A0A285U111_9BACL|nr:flagellar basal-body MS-ring/collar protein FliF [Ureibacillus acetophenoni]SOC35519.1 flagellar M-ring protein FliF [Ureibacillus acetophenoni]
MNERLTKVKTDSTQFWKSRSKKQKGTIVGTLIGVILLAGILTYFFTRTTMVPLFTELSMKEVGEISEVLTAQGTSFEIAPGGTNILVPESEVDSLKVSLASQGYPNSGEINNSFFTTNAGFGMTDNEFEVIRLAATQTELENLIKTIDGIKNANVMISLPKKGVFVNDMNQEASAAITLDTEPGHQFSGEQIATLYNLVSKSIPNLSTDNIVITNQHSEYFDLESATTGSGSVDTVQGQMEVKKTIERDLQRQVQQMLGTLMGQDKVVVSVTTDIDFKQENRQENIVQPVDEENMAGIEISAQRITETYTGSNAGAATGTPQGGVAEDPLTYPQTGSGDGEYERVEETINNDVNRITKEIQESPYKIRDIGIQVAVEPPVAEDVTSLSDSVRADIEQILSTIVRTSIDKEVAGDLTDQQIDEKIVVSVQPFYGNDVTKVEDLKPVIPWWIWVIGGILVVVIVLLVVTLLLSKRKQAQAEEIEVIEEQRELFVDDINEEKETESTVRRKQLEKMAKEKPEDFAKLLRSWIAEE